MQFTSEHHLGFYMTQLHHMPVLLPLLVATVAVMATILVQALPLGGTIWFVRKQRMLGRTGRSFWIDTGIVTLAILLALMSHLVEILLWAIVFQLCREFPDIGTAYYHSAVNFTTLGYGDVVLSSSWRLLGPLEAADGMLMFGVSAAMIFALIQKLAETRFEDLRHWHHDSEISQSVMRQVDL